jgi:hypothetical protein
VATLRSRATGGRRAATRDGRVRRLIVVIRRARVRRGVTLRIATLRRVARRTTVDRRVSRLVHVC